MREFLDRFLNRTTTYRLMLYYLIFLVGTALLLSALGILPFSAASLLFSALFLVTVGWITNLVFAWVFGAVTNVESVYITALILALIISPVNSISGLAFLFWAAVLAMAGKFILARQKKHLFNPAALAVFLTAVILGESATWWVGSTPMLIPVLAGGIFIVRKVQREQLVLTFIVTVLLVSLAFNFSSGPELLRLLTAIFLDTPILFFAFVMLTEPLTMPPVANLRLLYAALVGFLFVPQVHFGGFYTTPEAALLIGNLFSYLVGSQKRLVLSLEQKIPTGTDTWDFLFSKNEDFGYQPGQYLEWTLPGEQADSRGNRRYFTLASSPTESHFRLGVKTYQPASTFKQKMLAMRTGDTITASQLAGDFTLPGDQKEKLVFIAGGIGITPFRSMIKYLLDSGQKRPIVLLYANKTADEILYREVFSEAESTGIKTVYTLTDTNGLPDNWNGRTGRINEQMIKEEVPDYRERLFYLSGPRFMVTGFEEVLKRMGVSRGKIKVDYFPGF